MRIALYGSEGKVGTEVLRALVDAGHEVVDGRAQGPEGCDAAVDFTRPDAVVATVQRARAECGRDRDHGGLDVAVSIWCQGGRVPCFHAPNFEQGAILRMRFAEEARRYCHVQRSSSPSDAKGGRPFRTAKATAALGHRSEIHRSSCGTRGAPRNDPRRTWRDADSATIRLSVRRSFRSAHALTF